MKALSAAGSDRTDSAKTVLAVLLLADLAFIVTHLLLWQQDQVVSFPNLNLEVDRSWPEFFNYLKWGTCAAICFALTAQRRDPIYFAWGLLFTYLLIDDWFYLHETFGGLLANRFDLQPAFRLRSLDFGELAVGVMAATTLLGVLAVAYRVSGSRNAKAFACELMVGLAALAFFGIGVDMLHITLSDPTAYALAGMIEDGGEMIVASVLVYIVLKHALIPSPAP